MASWIQLAVECESMVEKWINFIFCLGTAYDISSMESIGYYPIIFVHRKSMHPKKIYLYLFRFELWHLYKSLLPSAKGLSIYFMLSNNKFLGKCWYGRYPWIRLAVECESMLEKGIKFNFCLRTAYDISSMESIGNYSIIFIHRKSMAPKIFSLYLFRFELWHLYKSLLPTMKGLYFTICNFYFLSLYLHL